MTKSTSLSHLSRYREIIAIFIKYQFGSVLDQLGVLKHADINKKEINNDNGNTSHIIKELSPGQRLRMAFEELGATFIKLGQILSTRPDILSLEIIKELEKLQDNVPAFPFEEVRFQVENELKDSIDSIFLEFGGEPIAAGSIAQVHLAKLKSGESVVVKVQRPGIDKKIDLDLKILDDLASFVDHHTKYGKLYEFKKMVDEFKKALHNELNFISEAENAKKLKENLKKDTNIYVPNVYWEYTTKSVLTLEYIDGIKLNDNQALEENNIDKNKVARIIATSVMNQVLIDGFFHADPHGGNILVMPENKITFLDIGMIGKLNEDTKDQFVKMLIGMTFKSSKLVVQSLIDQRMMTNWSNTRKVENDFDLMLDKYLNVPISEIKIGGAFKDIFDLAFLHKLRIPKEYTMLAKTLISLEGTLERLDPTISILEIAEPIAKKLLFSAFSFRKLGKHSFESLIDLSRLIKDLPGSLYNFFRKFESDDFTVYLEFKNIEKTLKHFDKIFNRITFGIALLALSIIFAAVIIGASIGIQTGGAIGAFDLGLLKVGIAITTLMVLWLFISMFRSGRF